MKKTTQYKKKEEAEPLTSNCSKKNPLTSSYPHRILHNPSVPLSTLPSIHPAHSHHKYTHDITDTVKKSPTSPHTQTQFSRGRIPHTHTHTQSHVVLMENNRSRSHFRRIGAATAARHLRHSSLLSSLSLLLPITGTFLLRHSARARERASGLFPRFLTRSAVESPRISRGCCYGGVCRQCDTMSRE